MHHFLDVAQAKKVSVSIPWEQQKAAFSNISTFEDLPTEPLIKCHQAFSIRIDLVSCYFQLALSIFCKVTTTDCWFSSLNWFVVLNQEQSKQAIEPCIHPLQQLVDQPQFSEYSTSY